jgi:hypothetical protein
VFDPLAISLVIAANFAFAQINPVKDPVVEEQLELVQEEQQYDPLDLNKDGIVDENERAIAKQKIEELEHNIETKSLSGWRTKKLQNEIDSLKSKVEGEDTTKTY